MRRKIQKIFGVCILTIVVAFACGCVETPVEENDLPGEEVTSEFQTEEDYRAALEQLGTEEADLQLRLEYYDKLWLLDAFTEEDFVALSKVYEAMGDAENLRNTLIRKHTYYPAETNLEEISRVIVYRDAADEEVKTLVDSLLQTMEEGNLENIKVLITSEEWKAELQDDLVGVRRKTLYTGSGYTAQIVSDVYETEVYILKEDTTLLYYKLNSAGEIVAETFWTDASYNGEYTIGYYTAEDELIKECNGTFDEGISVGDFAIKYDGKTYTGEFDENGKTTVEQKDKITDDGGVIYAYNKSVYKYLYEEDTTQDKFVIDYEYLGWPMYVAWE